MGERGRKVKRDSDGRTCGCMTVRLGAPACLKVTPPPSNASTGERRMVKVKREMSVCSCSSRCWVMSYRTRCGSTGTALSWPCMTSDPGVSEYSVVMKSITPSMYGWRMSIMPVMSAHRRLALVRV